MVGEGGTKENEMAMNVSFVVAVRSDLLSCFCDGQGNQRERERVFTV